MHVADLKSGPIAREPTRTERGKTPLVRQFGQRIDLVHELRKLAAAEEIANHRRQRLGVDQLLWRHRFEALIEQRHALLDQAFGASEADTALVGEQFADGAHPAAAEVIDVIEATL